MDDLAELQVALDSVALNELNNPEASALLDTIDGLRELQVGEIVNLPQIIVVGDQSSGKSSVLEAISRVRFPTKGDVCTRFATELVLRRAAKTRITVKIDSAGSKSAQQFHKTSFNKDVLPEIISEATEKMGIRPGAKKGFSQDILRVEISAPDVYPVTLVDLPGFFHSITAEQTEEDKKIVWQLTEKYMKQQNSIILTVVSANNNLANQTVVDEAKKYDPNRERTLGVITKPDLAAAGSEDEKKCLQLVRGQESTQNLRLGWHVLRNRSEGKEVASADERDLEEEQFFQRGAWSNIASTSHGIATLRKKLSKVLLGHIQKTLPGLIVEIESHLSSRQQALEQLGRPRSDPDDLRTYLIEIAQRYQRLARDSLNGHYADEFFGDLYEGENHKLRALLRKLNRAFYATLVTKGMDRQIEWDDDRLPLEGGFGWIKNGDSPPEYLSPFLDLFQEFPEPSSISESELCKELEDLGASNQGTEFPGLPNGQLGFQLFKMQAKPWGDIAEFYIDRVTDFAKVFVEELFIHVIGTDKQTANTILINYVDEFFAEKRKALKDKLEEILRPYKSAYGPPLDSEFHANLSSKMTSRDVERIASFLVERFPAAFTDKTGKGLTRESIEVALEAAETVRVSEFGTERVIEMAMTHYQMSLRTFAENTINLAVENCLVCELSTILTPLMVMRMGEERLKELASEPEYILEERETLRHEIDILRKGLKRCQKSRLHERTVLPQGFLSPSGAAPNRRSRSTTPVTEQEASKPNTEARSPSIFGTQPSTSNGVSGAKPSGSNQTPPPPIFNFASIRLSDETPNDLSRFKVPKFQ